MATSAAFGHFILDLVVICHKCSSSCTVLLKNCESSRQSHCFCKKKPKNNNNHLLQPLLQPHAFCKKLFSPSHLFMGIFFPLLLAQLNHLREVGRTPGIYKLLNVHNISIELRSRLWMDQPRGQILWSHFFVVVLEYFRSMSCCKICFHPSFNPLDWW